MNENQTGASGIWQRIRQAAAWKKVVAAVLVVVLILAVAVGALFVVYFWNLDQKLLGWAYLVMGVLNGLILIFFHRRYVLCRLLLPVTSLRRSAALRLLIFIIATKFKPYSALRYFCLCRYFFDIDIPFGRS